MKYLFIILFISSSLFAQFAGGDGSSGNPYQIATAEQLNEIRNQADGKYYKLITDIDLDDLGMTDDRNWTPDQIQKTFYFDGDNFTIKNLKIYDVDGLAHLALFGNLYNSIVQNLFIKNFQIIDSTETVHGGGGGDTYESFVVAYGGGIFKNIAVDSSIIKIRTTNTGDGDVGGILGFAPNGTDTVYRCAVTNSYIEFTAGTTDIYSTTRIGAIIGNVSATMDYIGESFASNVTISGRKSATSSGEIGALTGNLGTTLTIEDCYFIGDINITTTSGGSLYGFAYNVPASSINIRRCYSVVTNLSESWVSKYGWTSENQNVFYSYFNSDVLGTSKSAVTYTDNDTAVARTSVQMKDTTNYDASWDFVLTWGQNSTINDGYPYLGWLVPPVADSLIFHQPLPFSSYFDGDTIHISWYATKDSVRLILLGDTINVYGDTSYTYVISSSPTSFSITGEIINPNTYGLYPYGDAYIDIIYGLVVKPNKFIEIVTAEISDTLGGLIFSMVVYYGGIDSFNVYYNFNDGTWKLINRWTVSSDTTYIDDYFFALDTEDFGKIKLKAEESRNSTVNLFRAVKWHSAGNMLPDKRICYYTALPSQAVDKRWSRDPACGWSALAPYALGSTVLQDNFMLPEYQWWRADSVVLNGFQSKTHVEYSGECTDLSGVLHRNSKICARISFETRMYLSSYTIDEYNYPYFSFGGQIYRSDDMFGESNQSQVYGDYYYKIDKENKKVIVNDVKNSINNLVYCDFSDAYVSETEWVPPLFGVADIVYTFVIYPTKTIFDSCTTVVPGTGLGTPPAHLVLSNEPKMDSLMDDKTFIPVLSIVSKGNYFPGILVPLRKESPDLTTPIYDIYGEEAGEEKVIVNRRNYFRGIHPKIWKWGNIDGEPD